MCGIAGFVKNKDLPLDSIAILKKMMARIQYRGPDESGIFLNNITALGSVRLSIIDISSGQQPLSTQDKRFWIVYNGEIFNYIELRQELIRLGHEFKTESDTEVLLHAYVEFGPSCLAKLNGQFAFAIWDDRTKELFLARDRVGIRPLFYTQTGGAFVFASEIKSILEFPEVVAELDPGALAQVFTFWTTLSPGSVFKHIVELPPGNYMRVSQTKTEIRAWWKLRFPAEKQEYFQGSFQDAKEELYRLLTDAVQLRLRADVPVAAYLSGGLDSSATTALIKKVAPETLLTFSIGFEDGEFDETVFQQEVSQYLNTKHTQFTCTRRDIGHYFPQVIWHSEIPVLRTAPVPMYCLSRKVRENNIKVVITGEGSDEMLAGYDIFKEAIIREFWSKQPSSRYRPLLLNNLYPYLAQFQGRNMSMLKLFFGYRLQDTDSPFYSHFLRWKNTATLQNYLSDELQVRTTEDEYLSAAAGMLDKDFSRWNQLNKAQWLEIAIFMSGYLLSSQGDRMAMANSVEGRYPFLDFRVMEFAASLPPDFKMHGLNEKYILKQMMAGQLPERILKRPKQAYRAPISRSFLTDPRHTYVEEMLSENKLKESGLFKPNYVQKLMDKINKTTLATEIDNMALAGILSTQLLYFQFIDKKGIRPALRELTNCNKIINLTST